MLVRCTVVSKFVHLLVITINCKYCTINDGDSKLISSISYKPWIHHDETLFIDIYEEVILFM